MAQNRKTPFIEKSRVREFLRSPAFRISVIYLLVSLAWITGTGSLAGLIAAKTEASLAGIELIKGIGFVLITSALLYLLIRRSIASLVEHERKIQRLNRVYSVRSGINSAILRIRDKQQLLDEACQIAAVHGLYEAVSIRMIQPERGTVETVASAGKAKEFIDNIKVTLSDEDPYSHGPTGTAMREARAIIINDMGTEPGVDPWREFINQYHIRSSAAFPITIGEKMFGVFSFYSRETDAFDEDEKRLLEEMVADTALGLEYIEKARYRAFIATHDVVTGLPNRTLLEDRIAQYLMRRHYHPKRMAVLVVIVIENYTRFVDTYGPSTGDKIVKKMAEKFEDILREGDTIAKLGSHRYALFLVDITSRKDVVYASQKLLSQLPGVITINGIELSPQYRAGISVCPGDAADADSLIRYANLALTSARKEELFYRFYSSQQKTESVLANTIERQLRQALKTDEFILHYQPIIDIKNRTVTGVEALIRWNNKELGTIPPPQFIPVAEDIGLIDQIGNWVIEQAVEQLRIWHNKKGREVYITVNVASHQLRDKRFAGNLLAVMERVNAGLPKSGLALEITESTLMEHSRTVIQHLTELKEAGLSIYIDDFGTGYSSLSYLHRFPVNAVKIDREFINGLPHDKGAVALVKGIIGMAHGIDLRVVAEGVETEEQLDILKDLDCDQAQGYLFSKPGLPNEIVLH